MIIRKPYAFLIKNFRKIHIVLLLIGLFVLYKTIDTAGFVNDFMKYGTYDLYADPVTNHISSFMMIAIFLIIAGVVALLFLLLHKKKPWKTYIIPLAIYVLLFFVLTMIKSFFRTYTEVVDAANLRLSRDLLMIFLAGQLPALGVFIIRIFGLDVKKFDFNADLESLDLSEEDREEIEVSLNFDINTLKRVWRRFKRNAGYFYQEHKFISRAIIVVIIGLFIYNVYNLIFVVNKTYRQGEAYSVNGYTFTVNNAYFTNKDAAGNVIAGDSNFVVVNITVKNNSEPRNMNTSHFHLRAGTKDYVTTENIYAKEFEDFGTCYTKVKKLQRDEEITFIIVYKVDKSIKKNKFVFCYQEKSGIFKLRQIKLKVNDLSEIEKVKKLDLGDTFDVPFYGREDTLSIDNITYSKTTSYKMNNCSSTECYISETELSAPEGSKIMEIEFSSDAYEAKNMIDFLKKYGRINYKDSKGKAKHLDIDIAISKNYLGKKVYLVVPEDFDTYEDVRMNFVVRNKSYSYQLV